MPNQVDGALVHAMSGTELSRVRTEFRLRLPEPINQSLLVSRGAGIVMQSSATLSLGRPPKRRASCSSCSKPRRWRLVQSSAS